VRNRSGQVKRVEPLVLNIYLSVSSAECEISIEQHRILIVLRKKVFEFFQLFHVIAILVCVNQLISDFLNLINLGQQGDSKISAVIFLNKCFEAEHQVSWFVVSELWGYHYICV
jgi:hypothetical protein